MILLHASSTLIVFKQFVSSANLCFPWSACCNHNWRAQQENKRHRWLLYLESQCHLLVENEYYSLSMNECSDHLASLPLLLSSRCLHPDRCWSPDDVRWLPWLLWCYSGVPVPSRNRKLWTDVQLFSFGNTFIGLTNALFWETYKCPVQVYRHCIESNQIKLYLYRAYLYYTVPCPRCAEVDSDYSISHRFSLFPHCVYL